MFCFIPPWKTNPKPPADSPAASDDPEIECGACEIADRLLRHMAPVGPGLPPCAIRPAYLWWRQAGAEACRRCPQVATTPTAARPEDRLLARQGAGLSDPRS